MAEKVPTAIDEVIEGKQISVMICHECHDVCSFMFCTNLLVSFVKVIEMVEPFFDISLAIPEEKLLQVSWYII